MIAIKKNIQTRFNKATHSYDKVSYIQKTSAEFLAAQLHALDPEFKPKTILDVGTGTGYMPEILLPVFPSAYYTLNDITPNMITFVQNKFREYKNIAFCMGDMENVFFRSHDLTLSNLALQWSHHLENILNKLYRKSKILAFSCLLEGTFKEWNAIFNHAGLPFPVRQYPTENALRDFLVFLNPKTYCIKTKTFSLTFKNARAFMQYLRHLGASSSEAAFSKEDIKSIISRYNTPIQITYEIFFATIKRL